MLNQEVQELGEMAANVCCNHLLKMKQLKNVISVTYFYTASQWKNILTYLL